MKKNNLIVAIYSIIICVSSLSIYLNFLNHRSSIVQTMMTNDLNNNTRSESVLAYLPNLNTDIPNLTFTSIPIKAMISRYYRFQEDFTTALSLLDQSKNDNPFIMFYESEKAEIYDILKVRDSFSYYSKAAFYGLPKNQRHWLQYSKVLGLDNDSISLDLAFEKVKNEKDPIFRLIYITTNLTMDRKSNKLTQAAEESKKIFPNNKEITLVSDYYIYGRKNVDSAITLSKEANKLFKTGIYNRSSKIYKQAADLNPGDFSHFENAALSLLREGKLSESKKYFKHVIDSLNPKTGKAEYLLAGIYESEGNFDKVCDLLNQSVSFNFKLAFDSRAKLCFK